MKRTYKLILIVMCTMIKFFDLRSSEVPSLATLSTEASADALYQYFQRMTPFNTDQVSMEIIDVIKSFPEELRDSIRQAFVKKYANMLGDEMYSMSSTDMHHFNGKFVNISTLPNGIQMLVPIQPGDDWSKFTFIQLLDTFVQKMKESPLQKNINR